MLQLKLARLTAILIISLGLGGSGRAQEPPVPAGEQAAPEKKTEEEPALSQAYANYAKGISALIREDKEAALEFFNTALKHDPEAVAVLRNLAEIQQELGDAEGAKSHLIRALEIDSEDFQSNWELGRLYFKENKLDLATRHLEQAAKLKSGDIRLHFLLATLYRMTERMSDCATQYEIVLRSRPSLVRTSQALERIYIRTPDDAAELKEKTKAAGDSDFIPYFRLGLLYQRERNFNLARTAFETALKIEPEWSAGNELLGQIYRQTNQPIKAINAYLSAAISHPDKSELLYEVADIYIDIKNYERAVQVLESVRKLWPKYKDTLYRLVYCYELLAEHDKTIEVGQEYLERFGNKVNRMAYELMGRTYAALGRDKDAEKCIEEMSLIQQHTDNKMEFVMLSRMQAQIFTALKKRPAAIFVLEKGLEKLPDHADTRLYLAMLYDEEKLDDKAEESLKDVLRKDPKNHRALNHLGYFYAERGRNLEKAVTLIQDALKANPKNWAYLDSLGWAFFKMGRHQEALEKLHEAITIHDDSVLRDHLGDIYHAQGEISEAKAHWKKALEIDAKMNSVRKKLESLD
ncbi:MAG: tetratricopeptide repeat protein [Planctomycetota bacterium]|nr:tetratricopeptide repeat protein [Planctomycetota bacterium]